MKKYTINIKFAEGSCYFSNVSESYLEMFNLWMAGESEESTMEFNYKGDTYYLNRDFFCYGAIKEETVDKKKKNKLFG
jgi:hypothetical protein